ncbi:MAG TPA: 50S ribosomal protein L1 [Candidatus Saccharimonadales bacterium]|nr:50S ribosomal protein L1 [Candidatus Saccharimonadales bacterium]
MAKKAELVETAKKLKLDVGNKNTIAELEAAIKAAGADVPEPKPVETEADTPIAKAGKRSAKAIKEVEQKQAKEERKVNTDEAEVEKKPARVITPTRSRLERRGKKFRKAAEIIEKGKTYSLNDALALAVKSSPSTFDATVEMHIRLNVDPKHADQNIRDTVVLPGGTGKTVRVAVFSDDKVAGADVSGIEAITKMLDKQQLDFDVLVSTPANMAALGKYARVLGPRGFMPNPKSGTVTNDLAKAVTEAKAGRVEYRVDSTGILHVGVGKVSFNSAKLTENATALLASVRSNKPASVKGGFIKSLHVATTMGPSISVVIE